MALPLLPLLVLGVVVAAAAKGSGGSSGGARRPKIPKLGAMTQGQRLEAAVSSWLALLDATAKGYGDYYGSTSQVRTALEPGNLLYDMSDAWQWPLSMQADSARARWSAGDAERKAMIGQADELLRMAVEHAAFRETELGPLVTAQGEEISLLDIAEQYAADAAISRLVAMVPGAGTIAAVAEMAGVGWTNTTGRQEVPPEELRIEWVHARHLGFSRARDLIEHARG